MSIDSTSQSPVHLPPQGQWYTIARANPVMLADVSGMCPFWPRELYQKCCVETGFRDMQMRIMERVSGDAVNGKTFSSCAASAIAIVNALDHLPYSDKSCWCYTQQSAVRIWYPPWHDFVEIAEAVKGSGFGPMFRKNIVFDGWVWFNQIRTGVFGVSTVGDYADAGWEW